MIKIREVNDAINEILIEDEYFITRDGFVFLRIQNIAKKMHSHYWKYRDKILRRIHRWAEQHPSHSEWEDAKGRKWKIGYGQQMCPRYGTFHKNRKEDLLELFKVKENV